MKRRGESVPEDPHFLEKFFLETLVHQDIVTYTHGLRRKVQNVIHAGVEVLEKTYELVESFGTNHGAPGKFGSLQFRVFRGQLGSRPMRARRGFYVYLDRGIPLTK